MMKNRLTEVLKTKGITQSAFAEEVGITPQYMSAICTGKVSVSLKKLSRFAEMLEVPLTELIKSNDEVGVFCCPHCGLPIRVVKEGTVVNEEEEV